MHTAVSSSSTQRFSSQPGGKSLRAIGGWIVGGAADPASPAAQKTSRGCPWLFRISARLPAALLLTLECSCVIAAARKEGDDDERSSGAILESKPTRDPY